MRRLLLFTLSAAMLGASSAEARLFRQNYGAVIPAGADGCGCTWNWNQDYFVPRHCHSCRYGLFSPCKTSCTRSPACWWSHPIYAGYCNIYSSWRYGWRNHVYRCHCGCCPLRLCHHKPYCGPCRHGCSSARGDGWLACATPPMMVPFRPPLSNLEPPGLEVLGPLPIEGDELLASMNMTDEQDESVPAVLLPRVTPIVDRTLPLLGQPPSENLP